MNATQAFAAQGRSAANAALATRTTTANPGDVRLRWAREPGRFQVLAIYLPGTDAGRDSRVAVRVRARSLRSVASVGRSYSG